MSDRYMSNSERSGYDAFRAHDHRSYHDGGFNYQQGWDEAAGEERRARLREQERQEEAFREEQEEALPREILWELGREAEEMGIDPRGETDDF